MEYLLSRQAAAGFEFLEQTGSTNRDLLDKAASHPEFFVLATDFQTAGRGRMDRSWEAFAGSSIMASILLRPKFQDSAGVAWLSLLTALAITKSLEKNGLKALVKWPNDVLVSGNKISGILAEASEDLSHVVVGFGINVSQDPSQLPVESATSLAIETESPVDKDQLLADVITNLRELYQELQLSEGDAEASGLRQGLIEVSATIGQQVAVEFPNGTKAFGKAVDIDSTGRLLVQTANGTLAVSAGDVLHLRTA